MSFSVYHDVAVVAILDLQDVADKRIGSAGSDEVPTRRLVSARDLVSKGVLEVSR